MGPNKTSSKFSLSTITENPLHQTSINSDYPSDKLQLSPNRNNDTQNSNRIISPPPFYTKRPTRNLPQMSKFKFLPKRKSYNKITIDNSKPVTHSLSHPSLPHYTNVNYKSDTYQITLHHLTTLKRKLLSRFIQKRNILFQHLFNIGHSALFFTS